ncbi:hypothetical protein LDG_6150 [Legionella drancourtii LLAP12]|uniref:Uncharacterized protein n=2 Tax=Legionella drancourtii TaxID=168933 RepID=G9EL91_9GAMM|nr:hypothetical protein LDG_6150 [Legionella drancourtii LLAP12]
MMAIIENNQIMKKFIKLAPVHQTGHNCKTTAIATTDNYFSKRQGFKPMPLHKKSIAPLSIRQLAKTKGSVQGELLEIRQFSEIFADLGYETELVAVHDDFDSFKNTITNNIKNGNLVIACFAVDRRTGLPTTHYERDNEHAAILHGFDETTGQLDMTHWDEHRKTTMLDFYNSSMSLLEQRNPEYYVNIKHKDNEKKYDLISAQTGISFPSGIPTGTSIKKSLVPAPQSGFRGKLLVIKQPQLQNILAARNRLLIGDHKEIIIKLLENIKIKTDELIKKGNKKNKPFYDYQKAGKAALKLDKQLTAAAKQFLDDDELTLEEFKHQCETAINAAKPEFAKHRGWHQINSTLRTFLEVLAILSIVPAIMVAIGTKRGYQGIFFKTPKTDAAEKIESFMENLNKLR